jgi:triosephosphate isomerase
LSIIAANFKTNHTRASTSSYIGKLNDYLVQNNINDDVFIFPTATSLDKFENCKITVGVQNGYFVNNGSFTGEIGLEQLNEFDIKTILLGHSERRSLGEDEKLLKQKFEFFTKENFKIIYCIGEPIWTRKSGFENVKEYLSKQLESIDLDYKNLIIAYEPIWAIGTGLSATKEQIQETLNFLQTKTTAPLLYGGSVKANTIKDTLSIDSCSGVLVGSASWKVEDFCELIKKGI